MHRANNNLGISPSSEVDLDRSAVNASLFSVGFLPRTEARGFHRLEEAQTIFLRAPVDHREMESFRELHQLAHAGFNASSPDVITLYPERSHVLYKVKYCLIRFIFGRRCVCLLRIYHSKTEDIRFRRNLPPQGLGGHVRTGTHNPLCHHGCQSPLGRSSGQPEVGDLCHQFFIQQDICAEKTKGIR